MRVVTILLNITLFLSTLNVMAAESVETRLAKSLQKVFPELDITDVNSTPIENLYEVIMGPDVVYMSSDGRFILKGDLIDIKEKRNLTEDLRQQSRADILQKIPAGEYIEFASKNNKDTLYVFTDVDCGYCRKLHNDVPELNKNAITVRYLAYPRAGVGSSTFQQMANIWCAEDRPQALTDAKNGKRAKARKCKNPVKEQYALGQEMGVRGTPAIFLESGRAVPGYMPPADLLRILGR